MAFRHIRLALGAMASALAATPPAFYSLSPLHHGFYTGGRVPFFAFHHDLCRGVTAPIGRCWCCFYSATGLAEDLLSFCSGFAQPYTLVFSWPPARR